MNPPQQNRGTKNSKHKNIFEVSPPSHSLSFRGSLYYHTLPIQTSCTIFFGGEIPQNIRFPIVLSLQNGWHLITLEILRGVNPSEIFN